MFVLRGGSDQLCLRLCMAVAAAAATGSSQRDELRRKDFPLSRPPYPAHGTVFWIHPSYVKVCVCVSVGLWGVCLHACLPVVFEEGFSLIPGSKPVREGDAPSWLHSPPKAESHWTNTEWDWKKERERDRARDTPDAKHWANRAPLVSWRKLEENNILARRRIGSTRGVSVAEWRGSRSDRFAVRTGASKS